MEDQKRGMAGPGRVGPTPRSAPQQEGRLNVMIIRRVGSVLSFRISPRILWVTLIFFLIYLPGSVYIINAYLDLRFARKIQTNIIRQQEEAAVKNKGLIRRSKEKISFLEDYLHNLEGQEEARSIPPLDPESLRAGHPRFAQGGVSEGARDPLRPPEFVDIEDLAITKQGSQVAIRFKLINAQAGDGPTGGYVHLIARDTRAGAIREWASPREPLQDGFPTDYRRGRLFLIKNFKLIHGRFDMSPDGEAPAAIRVLVYNHAGQLILEEEFEVTHAL